jgi:2-oxoglutarate dehydrogenase E2 component (dihydrolipoamide succinyltransferase)
MPQLGETVTEGTILKWAKQVGDTIAEDEVLVEISTDKVDTEVPSPVGGTILEILVEEGETVEVGTELVRIGDEAEEPASGDGKVEAPTEAAEEEPEPEAAEEEPEPEPEPEEEPEPEPDEDFELHPGSETPRGPDTGFEVGEEPSADRVEQFFAEPHPGSPRRALLSPVVRKLIREHEVDLSKIEGSGAGGRITRKDVEAHLEKAPAAKEAPAKEAPAAKEAPPKEAPKEPEKVEAPKEPAKVPAAKAAPGEEVDLDRLRVRIAENMAKAKSTAVHVWTSVEVDYERLERVRQAHKEEFKRDEGFSLTYLPFIARATIDALKEYPVVNSSLNLEEKKAIYHKKVDLGIAIDLDQGGLVVARVRNADGLRLVGIAREIRALAEKARAGKLDVDDLTGSTFTITNPGPFGSFMSAPIINVPNVAILSTETVAKRATVVTTPEGQDTIAIRHIGYLGLSWDHRAFDGSTAVLFLNRIKENIQSWDWNQELA